MALYSEKVMDHFLHPRNVGVIEDADAVGEVGNAKCGDIMKMYLKIKDGIVTDVKFETFGCGSAIASSSMATEMIKGKPLSEVKTLTNQAVTEALDGLPAHKIHCSVLAEEAIRSALEDYQKRQNTGGDRRRDPALQMNGNGGGQCRCRQIYHIIADENGAEHLVPLILDLQHLGSTPVSILSQRPHPDAADRRKCRLCGRKERRKHEKNHQNQYLKYDARIQLRHLLLPFR